MLTKIVADRDLGYRHPWYYGYSYSDFELRQTVLAVIPFNFLIAWGRGAWWKLRRGPSDPEYIAAMQRIHGEAFSQGYTLGLRDGTQRESPRWHAGDREIGVPDGFTQASTGSEASNQGPEDQGEASSEG